MKSDPEYRLVVIASSAGGIKALIQILSALPTDFPLPIVVVQHQSRHFPDLLAEVLGRRTKLPVKRAELGEKLLPGHVYLAPFEPHLVVQPDRTLAFRDGRRIRHVLSSANPLFSTAAEALGPIIGVVLTGKDSDATDGVQSIKAAGGIVIAQDQATAEHPQMPESAIRTGAVGLVLPLEEIGPRLLELSRGEVSPKAV